ncbi:hypothetical protein [Planktothrix tepida]|uniref:Uncharacterized protein n=1 Tax=Planktothrix tepida PCC 9214 TaxID=671072 RepID=A0A1J1LDD0_9CYAN|nr:hypothetical protein [Planktothrix tepida]CUR30456.1 hypothetical protein PL9214290046 [Planktothrix tepida PCC 9214]
MTEKAYESVTFGEAGTGVLEIPKVAIEGIWRFSEMSNIPSRHILSVKLGMTCITDQFMFEGRQYAHYMINRS